MLLPRLTQEARLLGDEPWAKEVSLFDSRLGAPLFKDEQSRRKMYKALLSRKVPRDRPFCAAPPCWDFDLLRLPLRTLTRNCLSEARLGKLSAVAARTPRELLALTSLGVSALADLLAVLDVCCVLVPPAADPGRDPTLADFCAGVVARTRDAAFAELFADRIAQVRALGCRCEAFSLEEELASLAAAIYPAGATIALASLGWDGRRPRPLRTVGRDFGLSGERIRQQLAAFEERRARGSAWTPRLRQALDVCGRHSSRPASAAAILLRDKGMAAAPFHPSGLLSAADAFGLLHSLFLRPFQGQEWLLRAEEMFLLKTSLSRARATARVCGVCSVGDLLVELRAKARQDLAEDVLREWVGWLPGVCWLDAGRQWFCLPAGSSQLEGPLWKILAVAPELSFEELRAGLTRGQRTPARMPPAVFREFCRHLGLHVDGDTVRVARPMNPKNVLTPTELIFFKIFRGDGPLLSKADLMRRCRQHGMKPGTCHAYLSYNPILVRRAPGVYALRGSRASVDEVSLPQGRINRRRMAEECGRRQDGVAWIAYTISQAFLHKGAQGIPLGMRRTLGEGSWPLFAVDGTRVGTAVCQGGVLRGLRAFFRRHGVAVGSILVLEIDRRTAEARVRVGGPNLIEQARGDRAGDR